jgi:hypothetical protein
MTFKRGDYVYPRDLPRRFLCLVSDAEALRVRGGTAQILKLAPLEGPWPEGRFLIRLGRAVRPVACRGVVPRGTPRRRKEIRGMPKAETGGEAA